MRVSEVVDEFENSPQTLKWLFRVQKARCHEFMTYYKNLETKYPKIKGILFTFNLNIRPSTSSASPEQFKHNIGFWGGTVSPDTLNKFTEKYARMINAKKAYEKAGGTYVQQHDDKQSNS